MAKQFDLNKVRMAEGLGNVMQDYLADNVPEAERVKLALSVAMTYAFMNRWSLRRVIQLARSVYELCSSMFTKGQVR